MVKELQLYVRTAMTQNITGGGGAVPILPVGPVVPVVVLNATTP